jgi:ketosteroid isomerase-like protein
LSESRNDEGPIRKLVATYCHAIAERDEKAWAATWAEDGEWIVLGQTVRGREAILAHYRKLVARVGWVVQLAWDGIVEVQGDRGFGRWQILELLQWEGGAGGLNVGRYRDAYARGADGEWRFARRELHVTYLGPPDLSAALASQRGPRVAP